QVARGSDRVVGCDDVAGDGRGAGHDFVHDPGHGPGAAAPGDVRVDEVAGAVERDEPLPGAVGATGPDVATRRRHRRAVGEGREATVRSGRLLDGEGAEHPPSHSPRAPQVAMAASAPDSRGFVAPNET